MGIKTGILSAFSIRKTNFLLVFGYSINIGSKGLYFYFFYVYLSRFHSNLRFDLKSRLFPIFLSLKNNKVFELIENSVLFRAELCESSQHQTQLN